MTLPKVLLVNLKRATPIGDGDDTLRTLVKVPRRLNLGALSFEAEQDKLYELIAAISHIGCSTNGHYVAHVRGSEDKRWFRFSDEWTYLSSEFREDQT